METVPPWFVQKKGDDMNDKDKRIRWMHCWQSLVLLVVLILSGCAAKELSFETVKEFESDYTDIDPDFWVLTSPEDMDALKPDLPIPSAVSTELQVLDYQRYFVIVIWRGQLPVLSSKYIIEPNQVLLYKDKIVVQVHYDPFDPEFIAAQAISSPALVLAVSKTEPWSKEIRFTLEVDGQEVKEHSFFIP
jgi:hypothetical protein